MILSFFIFAPQMFRMTVCQANGLTHFLSHTDLFARSIDEFELTVREEDGLRDARETAASTEIEDASAWTETDGLGDGQ